MKVLFTSIIFVLIFFTNLAFSEQKIVFINMDRLISTSNAGASIFKQLTNLNNKNLKFLKSEEKKFKEKEIKLISQKNILSEADFKNKVNKLKIDNTNNFLKLINLILDKFSNDKEIAIILQKKDLVVSKLKSLVWKLK